MCVELFILNYCSITGSCIVLLFAVNIIIYYVELYCYKVCLFYRVFGMCSVCCIAIVAIHGRGDSWFEYC